MGVWCPVSLTSTGSWEPVSDDIMLMLNLFSSSVPLFPVCACACLGYIVNKCLQMEL